MNILNLDVILIFYFYILNSTPLLIDIHTHQTSDGENISIRNLHQNFNETSPLFFYSTGIHPWYINDKTYQQDLITMKIASQQNNVLAIGECGLDRLCDTDFKLQQKVFIEQIIWANEIAKPLIIHCVRAYRETLSLIKEHNRTSPFIFHGFNKNEEVANEILNAGGMLSFGKWVFNPIAEKLVSSMASGSFFLETDDDEITIEAVYKQVAKIKNLTSDQLNHQIQHNFKRIFKTNF